MLDIFRQIRSSFTKHVESHYVFLKATRFIRGRKPPVSEPVNMLVLAS